MTPHDDPHHRCTWACPQSNPLADIRELKADAEAGMTPEELERKYGFHDPADRAAVMRELGIEPVDLIGQLDDPPDGYPGAIRLVGDDIVKPWRYRHP